MRNGIVVMLMCLPVIVACGTIGSGKPAFGQPGASVERVPYAPAGVYTFNFKRDEIYTPSTDRRNAIERYLGRNPNELPPNCSLGVEVLDIVDGENGNSAASFRCKVTEIKLRRGQ